MNIITTSNLSIRVIILGTLENFSMLKCSWEGKSAGPAIYRKWSFSQKALRLQTYGFPSTFRGPKIRLLPGQQSGLPIQRRFSFEKRVDGRNADANETENKMNLERGDCNPGNATRESKEPLSLELIFSRENSHFLLAEAMKQLGRARPFVSLSKQFEICQLVLFFL